MTKRDMLALICSWSPIFFYIHAPPQIISVGLYFRIWSQSLDLTKDQPPTWFWIAFRHRSDSYQTQQMVLMLTRVSGSDVNYRKCEMLSSSVLQVVSIFIFFSTKFLWTSGLRAVWCYLREELLAGSVSLQLVDVLHEDALVLEHVTFGPQVQAMVPAHRWDIYIALINTTTGFSCYMAFKKKKKNNSSSTSAYPTIPRSHHTRFSYM